MTGRHRLIIAGLVCTGLLLFVLSTCLLGVTKEARIDQFLQDLNNPDRSDMYLNFSTSATLYPTLDDTFFGLYFWEDSIPYTLTSLDFSANPVTGTIAGKGAGSFSLTPLAIEFTMVQEGFDWMISNLWVEVLGDVVY